VGRAPPCLKSAFLRQGSACPPHLGGGGRGLKRLLRSRGTRPVGVPRPRDRGRGFVRRRVVTRGPATGHETRRWWWWIRPLEPWDSEGGDRRLAYPGLAIPTLAMVPVEPPIGHSSPPPGRFDGAVAARLEKRGMEEDKQPAGATHGRIDADQNPSLRSGEKSPKRRLESFEPKLRLGRFPGAAGFFAPRSGDQPS